jgi:hypothetical protein
MKNLVKNQEFSNWLIHFFHFFDNHGYIIRFGFLIFLTIEIMNIKNCHDNCLGFILVFNHWPTLVFTSVGQFSGFLENH